MSVTRHQAVGAFQRWMPPSFDDAGRKTEDAGQAAEAQVADQEPLQDTDAPLERDSPETRDEPPIKFPTAQEVESMMDEAREAGRAAGYEEGAAQARAEAESLQALLAALEDGLARLDQEIAEELVTLAVEVARQLVRHTLADHPSAIAEAVREALLQLPQNQVRIHINPDDAKLVREYLADQLEHGHHRLIEDDAILRGGCRLESAGSEVDATVETRWRRVLEGLGRKESAWED